MFGLSTDAPGMYEMLLPPPHNRFDTIYPTGHDGMFVMPSGEAKFRPTIWEMEWLYERLGQHFDCIVTEFDD